MRVARDLKGGVFGARPHSEFVEVGLAEDGAARFFDLSNDGRVIGRDVLRKYPGRARRSDAAGVDVVFDGYGQSGKRADALSLRPPPINRFGLGQQVASVPNRDEGAYRR